VLSFYHTEQETASLDGLGVSVFLWCKVKENSFLFILLAGSALFFLKNSAGDGLFCAGKKVFFCGG